MSKATQNWLEQKFIEWRNAQPRGKDSVVAFAAYLGVSRNSLNNWLNRGQTPDLSSVVLLARLGAEIYDLMGMPRPDPKLQRLIEVWGQLSDEARAEIEAIRERSAARRETGTSGGRVAADDRRRTGSN